MSEADRLRGEAERLGYQAVITEMLAYGDAVPALTNGDEPLYEEELEELEDDDEEDLEIEALAAYLAYHEGENGGNSPYDPDDEDDDDEDDEPPEPHVPHVPRRVRVRIHQPPKER